MTPDKKPFFAGTYFPRESRLGRIGMTELVPRVEEVWRARQDDVLSSADQITAALQQASQGTPGETLDEAPLRMAYGQLDQRFDEEYGGFGSAPKFPTPHNLMFLLRYWRRTGLERSLLMVEKTLHAMRCGGVYDHVGFGFHRYSTDATWLVPHFEKMLYDQAMLAMAYTEAYQATGKDDYGQTAREIFTYVLRDMTAPTGGFYSSEDADSEGEEGKFYLWTEEEIRHILGGEEADLIGRVWNVEPDGNFREEATGRRTGANILHRSGSLIGLASFLGLSADDLRERVEGARQKLFAVRERRFHPYKDDKILTDWNGLMIAALSKGAQVFDESDYVEAAKRAVDFLLTVLRDGNGRLLHRYRDGEAAIPAYLDDYAFLIWGLIELYEATFEVGYLQTALDLNRDLLTHFWDERAGGLCLTADDSEDVLVRRKEVYDGAVPSGNSVAMLNFLRLGRITGDTELERRAEDIGRAFSKGILQSPAAHTQLMMAVDFGIGPSCEVVVVGDPQAEETHRMVKALRRQFLPHKVVLFRPSEEVSPEIARVAGFTRALTSLYSKATAYVCRNYTCGMPTTDVETMLRLFTEI
jgi:uncharacterized protein YyaL (SSP411 family)